MFSGVSLSQFSLFFRIRGINARFLIQAVTDLFWPLAARQAHPLLAV